MSWVKNHLDDADVRVVDCRFELSDPEAGLEAYRMGHIPGAVYFDLEKDLSAEPGEHGGRHPLPDPDEFAAKLGKAGIDSQITVVAYDDQGGMVASRLWWMLRYLGHEKVYVMDGSFSRWKQTGYPVSADIPTYRAASFTPQLRSDMAVDINQVKERKDRPGTVLIDSRDNRRYRGEVEPIDPVAGHIPGAINHFWKESLNEDGTWKSPAEQKERFKLLNQADEILVYCGSGVSACPNILALDEAGFQNVKLYVGSWSDWSSYQDNPVERDES
ncbi:MAG: sulfurtransferase [Bacillaceae bacterium]|nr:sulfurtransferase [Bacillaceae bacterium]